MNKESHLYYCLGLIVGEGSFTGDLKTPALNVRLHERDLRPQIALQTQFGGVIYGPYLIGGRHFRDWKLRGLELWNSLEVFQTHLPSSYKRDQFLEWRAKNQNSISRTLYIPSPDKLRSEQAPGRMEFWKKAWMGNTWDKD